VSDRGGGNDQRRERNDERRALEVATPDQEEDHREEQVRDPRVHGER
jgi:hypothetical protein